MRLKVAQITSVTSEKDELMVGEKVVITCVARADTVPGFTLAGSKGHKLSDYFGITGETGEFEEKEFSSIEEKTANEFTATLELEATLPNIERGAARDLYCKVTILIQSPCGSYSGPYFCTHILSQPLYTSTL